jgi:hypothetical protein
MYAAQLDIFQRICQHLGVRRVGSLGESSPQFVEINSAYDKIRTDELQAHLWRYAIRRAGLRPITSTMRLITFPAYASGTTYQQGDIVNDTTANVGNNTSGLSLYISLVASNTGNTPSSSAASWTPYFGPDCADNYSASNTYSTGEIVYYSSGSGSKLYLSTANANINNTPTGGAPWTAAALTSATSAVLFLPYPITQASSGVTRTAYRLPVGYMRVAPQDVKVAAGSFQTTSAGMQYSDFEFEGNYLLTSFAPQVATNGPLLFRFGADISDVSQMNPAFAECFSIRAAFDLCERLTQKPDLKGFLDSRYAATIMRARKDNMLEQGSTDPEENDYLVARVPIQVEAPPQQRGR